MSLAQLVLYITHEIGYNIIFIICTSIAIAKAKKGNPWVWFGIGAVWQLLPIILNVTEKIRFGKTSSYSSQIDTVSYFVILIVGLIIILIRKSLRKTDNT